MKSCTKICTNQCISKHIPIKSYKKIDAPNILNKVGEKIKSFSKQWSDISTKVKKLKVWTMTQCVY